MLNKNKKGIQLNQAFGAVLTLVLISVLVIIAIYMFVTLGNTFSYPVSIVNETGTINGAGHLLTNSTLCNFGSPVISEVLTSAGGLVPPANYTLSGNTVLNTTATTYSNALIRYSYTWGGNACAAAQNTTKQFSDYPALIGLVGTIIFLGIIIGVLVASFVFGGRKENA